MGGVRCLGLFPKKNRFFQLTPSLTAFLVTVLKMHPCRLVNLFDVTLAFKYANSKLVDIVTVADIDDEEHVCNSLVEIVALKIGRLLKILKLKFGQYVEADVWSRFCVQKFGRDLEAEAWTSF